MRFQGNSGPAWKRVARSAQKLGERLRGNTIRGNRSLREENLPPRGSRRGPPRNPTSVSANLTDVFTNVENWRTSIQLLKGLTGQVPMQEDIKAAFEKLIAPVLKNVSTF